MILIISHQSPDHTTCEVMDWLEAMGVDFIRLNGETLLSHHFLLDIGDKHLEMAVDNRTISIDDIAAVWYRRDAASRAVSDLKPHLDQLGDPLLERSILTYASDEMKQAKIALYTILDKKPWLPKPGRIGIKKIETLLIAKRCGLHIPDTIITNNKNDILKFKEKHRAIITKPISESQFFNYNGGSYGIYTEEAGQDTIDNCRDDIFPSLVQEMIQKEFEIRVFYLDGRCYSMAIFSQADSKTNVDFRRYNGKKPNRTVPYKLPESVEENISSLMKSLDLNTGSIDIIKSVSGQYVFLEVNPTGQFGMVSHPCNYYLEHEIASYLAGHITRNSNEKSQ